MSLYLFGFLLAVAGAPHRHLNSLADLLSEGRTDSGIFVESTLPDSAREPGVQPARLVDDHPCLACFHHDYASSPTAFLAVDESLTPRLEPLTCENRSVPQVASESPASRSPPRAL